MIQGKSFLAYDLLTLFGMISGFTYVYFAFKRIPIKQYQIYLFIFSGFIAQFFGGTVLPFFYQWMTTQNLPPPTFWIKPRGRYFHSVFLSMILFTLIFCKIFKWPTRKILDHFMIGAMIASAIGRIGCFLHGCCRGKPTNLPWAIHLPPKPDLGLHPTQIYMLIIETIIIFYLLWLNPRKKYDGETFWKGIFIYAIYRTLIEFFRVNPVAAMGLTHAQIFSLLSGGLAIVVMSYYQDQKR